MIPDPARLGYNGRMSRNTSCSTRSLVYLSILAQALVFGCGGEPANVAGSYTIAVTNAENGCNFDNWVEGETSQGIMVDITQNDTAVSAQVEGLTGTLLSLVLGSNVYTGEVDGSHLELIIYGEVAATQGNCTFTYNSIIDADSDGDVLTGEIRYEAATVGNPDCAAIEGCVTRQQFNGTRPPTP